MIIMIWFIFGCSEYGMPLFLAIYNAKQCPDHVNYLIIKFIVFLQVKAHQVRTVISRNKLIFLGNISKNKLKVDSSCPATISISFLS